MRTSRPNRGRRILLAAGATAGLLALGVSPALAHECYVANRSTQGSLSAGTHSQIWSDDLLTFDMFVDFARSQPDMQITDEQAAQAKAIVEAQGVPTAIAIGGGSPFDTMENAAGKLVQQAGGSGGDIADRSPSKVKSDGHGIEHLGDDEGPLAVWIGAIMQVAGAPA
jgi:hypothetical protein